MDHFVTELRWLRERFAKLAEGAEQPVIGEVYRANDVLYALINTFHTLSQIAKR